MRRWITWTVAVSLVLAAGAALLLSRPGLQDRLVQAMARQRIQAGPSPLLADDALRVVICGSASPLPDTERARSCVAIIAGGAVYVVDTGPGSAARLAEYNVPTGRLAAVFLTHFHSDHIGDLGELNFLSWGNGRGQPLPVYGGPGVEDVVAGFNQAYGADHHYRTAHHTEAVMPHEAGDMVARIVEMQGPPDEAMDRLAAPLGFGDLTVTAIEVDHRPSTPAYGWRFDYKGRSVVVSGDTRYHPPLAVAAKGADVLIHEAQSQRLVKLLQATMADSGQTRLAHILTDIQSYHTETLDAVRIGNEAGVRLLVLTHFTPPLRNALIRHIYFDGVDALRQGAWDYARDGMLITLPLGGTAVKVSQIG
jgi:ribonuclease Z